MAYMIFDDCKTAVSLQEAVKHYGFTPNQAGFICCPFHNEKTASMKLYEHSFHCFGCGAHGSVIDFVMMLFNLEPLEAVKRLNEDFMLQLDLDRPPDPDQLKARQEIDQAKKLFESWQFDELRMLTLSIRKANQADFSALTESEAIAVRFKEALEDWADTLQNGQLDQQMEIFRDRGRIEKLCKMILQNTLTKSTAA